MTITTIDLGMGEGFYDRYLNKYLKKTIIF